MDSAQHRNACLVADVGGTHARLGWCASGDPIDVRDMAMYRCAEHASLAAILENYLLRLCSTQPGVRVTSGVVAIAGFLDGDRLVNANLPWKVSVRGTAQDAGLVSLQVINDFEAVARAIPGVQRSALVALVAQDDPGMQSPALVLGPGTGLGAALCLDAQGSQVLLSEAGHAALAANTAVELDVLQCLSRRWSHVDNERVLSGNGLMHLYDALADVRGAMPHWKQVAPLVEAAHGDDPLARETLAVFCGWLGSLVGDLVLTVGARQAYLAGGVTRHIAPFLHQGDFARRYAGKFTGTRAPPPVWRIDHGQLGLVGAAMHARTHRPARVSKVEPSSEEQA
jgi:glucokinase